MRRFFITGERFTSIEAERIGLIDIISTDKDIDDIIHKYVSIIRSSGPNAIKEVKKLVDSLEKLSIDDYKEHTVKKIAELRISKEGQEGINAFLEKRKSQWSE